MIVYIAGPMTGYENFNREAFFEAEKKLRALGHEPRHTARLPDNWAYMDYINFSLNVMRGCEAIYLLDGWEKSKGVTEYELPLAKKLNLSHIKL